MIVIRDQQLRLMVLAHLIRELQAHAQDHGPIPEGFSEKQIEELQALSSAELVKLSEMAEPRVAIQIDAGSLEHGLRQVDYLTKRSKQLEYFIVNGATSNMLSKLFKISSADVTLKRRLFSGHRLVVAPPRDATRTRCASRSPTAGTRSARARRRSRCARRTTRSFTTSSRSTPSRPCGP
jgi:hypothetical protein